MTQREARYALPPTIAEFVARLGEDSDGRPFTQLCASILRHIGFTDIYIRKGAECGRDIDARLGDEKWAFECKNSSATIDTARSAYKLLQLDCVDVGSRPDNVVLISNGQTASILRDIVASRNGDPSASYSTYLWCNDEEGVFDDILLSYPDALSDFLSSHHFGCSEADVDVLRRASTSHVRLYQRFFSRFLAHRTKIAARRESESRLATLQANLAWDQFYKSQLVIGPDIVLVAAPTLTDRAIYNFANAQTLNSILTTAGKLGLKANEADLDAIRFGEGLGNSTIITCYGGVAVGSYMLGQSFAPEEWLPKLRENALRLRNFARLGILPTPFSVKAYICCACNDRRAYILSRVGGTDDLKAASRREWSDDELSAAAFAPRILFSSKLLAIEAMPHSHYEIARPLASSIWLRAGYGDLGEYVQERFRAADLASAPQEVLDLAQIAWIVQDEVLDRDFHVFEDFVLDDD